MRKRIVMVSLSILLLFSQCVWAEDPVSIETGETQNMELVAVPEDQYGTADLEGIEKYGNVTLSILCQDFLDAGYQYGDVVTVSFLDQSLDIPFCSDYFNVNTGEAVLVAKDQEPNLKLAVCLGDFASTYGIAAKTVEDDETITWNYADGVDGPVEFCISMKEPGGYYGMYLAHLLDYSDERSDFPDLTDEQFANFRMIATTGIGENILYRSASPIDPQYNRNTYADEALKNAGVTFIMNLVDDEGAVQSYEGYADTYYATVQHIALNMSFDYTNPQMEDKLAKGLRYFAQNPGVYVIHCTEGRNRTGYVSALVECFMGASCEEVISDYMVTYYNYFGITPDDDRYDIIAQGNIVKPLQELFQTDDLETADLAACAEAYFRRIGLTDDEINALRKNLGGQG